MHMAHSIAFSVPQSVLYEFAGIASVRNLQDMIDLVSFNTSALFK